jgi:hypothetical protein
VSKQLADVPACGLMLVRSRSAVHVRPATVVAIRGGCHAVGHACPPPTTMTGGCASTVTDQAQSSAG